MTRNNFKMAHLHLLQGIRRRHLELTFLLNCKVNVLLVDVNHEISTKM